MPSCTLCYLYKTSVPVQMLSVLSVDWVQIKPYEMVKYRKRVENWCSHVPKRTTLVGGARHSEHIFADACRRR